MLTTLQFITDQPQNKKISEGTTAIFKVAAIGDATLSYQWQKNGADISGATDSSYTTPVTTSADSGDVFRVIVTNSSGSDTSQECNFGSCSSRYSWYTKRNDSLLQT